MHSKEIVCPQGGGLGVCSATTICEGIAAKGVESGTSTEGRPRGAATVQTVQAVRGGGYSWGAMQARSEVESDSAISRHVTGSGKAKRLPQEVPEVGIELTPENGLQSRE